MTTDASSPRSKLRPAGYHAAMIAAAFRVSLWAVMTFAAFALGVYAFAFFAVDAINPPFKLRFEAYPVLARLHILPAGLALIVGTFQLSRQIRTTYPALHRYSGRIYIVAVVAGAVGGFVWLTRSSRGCRGS